MEVQAFRILINKLRNGASTRFEWPEWWGKYYDKVQIVAYQDVGQAKEWAVGYADAALAKQMAAEGPEIQLIHPDLADYLASTWVPETELITDPNRVLALAAKAARGEKLTPEERAALDPDDPTPGVNKRPPRAVTRLAQEAEAVVRPEGFIPKDSAAEILNTLKQRGLR